MSEEIVESNKTQCKKCLEFKDRIFVRKVKKDKLYADSSGLLWNGRMCPQCHKNRCKGEAKSRRDQAKLIMDMLKQQSNA